MTVISTLMTKFCTVHASDSLITEQQSDGSKKIRETQQSKIIRVKKWRGALSYWGLAVYEKYNWSTYDWLQGYAKKTHQYSSAEKFAEGLKLDLKKAISKMKFKRQLDAGIGIHFTAYEYIKNHKIPELFLIKNYEDPTYRSLYPDGSIRLFRNTFAALCKMSETEKKPEHREFPIRKVVYNALQSGRWLTFNNGDPLRFNIIANAIFNMYQVFAQRKVLREPTAIETYHDIAFMSMKIISDSESKFCQKKHRLAGGKVHVIAVTPTGRYISKTGD